MPTLKVNLEDLTTRISSEVKALRTLINGNAADLTALDTTATNNLVAAINELFAGMGAGGLDESEVNALIAAALTTEDVPGQVTAAVAALVGTAPGALNTLGEIADALNDDASLYTTLTGLISAKWTAVDASETVKGYAEIATTAEIQTGTDNGRIVSPAGLRAVTGDMDTDLVAVFEAGLV